MARSSYESRMIWCLFILLGSALSFVRATPKWTEVNSVDVYGDQCTLQTYHQYPCPRLCVRDISDCPVSIRPSCSEGQVLCVDGSCRVSCPANLASACGCLSAPPFAVPVYACNSGQRTDIPNFVVTNKSAQSAEACAIGLGISTTISAWDGDNPPNIMWGECPTPDYGQVTFTEPVLLALYVFYGACLCMLIFWTTYKRTHEKNTQTSFINEKASDGTEKRMKSSSTFSSSPQIMTSGIHSHDSSDESSMRTDEDDCMLIKFYKRNLIGTICFVLYVLMTLGHIAFMIMITNDYYEDYILFRGSQIIQSSTFIGMWYLFFFWFASLSIFRSRLMNFFRIRCTYIEADHVQIECCQPSLIFLQDQTDRLHDLVHMARRITGHDVRVNPAKMQTTQTGARYFVYQCTWYVYEPQTASFKTHDFKLGDTTAELARLNSGLSTGEVTRRQELIGPNFIKIQVPSVPMAFLREFASFFYIYQFTVLWLFYYFAYWEVGIADTSVILVSAVVKVFIRLRSERRIKRVAEFTDTVGILRDGEWRTMSTADIVPGDVIALEEGKTMPCDGVILSGNIVADESSLTGEPLPIRKFPLRADDTTPYNRFGDSKISTLFCGTTISQARPTMTASDQKVCALATHTGTSTDKGELIKKILFPASVSFVFNQQLKITIVILLGCGVVCLGLAIWLYATGTNAWFYTIFCIAQLLSPLLPAALVIGQSVSAGRLRSKKIYCIDLSRILMAGKVQLFCFDKTGTLTKEGLEFFGVRPVVQQRQDEPSAVAEFEAHYDTIAQIPWLMQMGLATCHAVSKLNSQFIGNPVDIEMFRASGWTLTDTAVDALDSLLPPPTSSVRVPIHVLKRFEFVHERMSMSVAVLNPQTSKVHIFVKGAYEKIKDLCHLESIPPNYDQITADLARQGCYVLALAHRELDLEAIGGLTAFRSWTRDQMEGAIQFFSLLIFKNQLKADTAEHIAALKQGDTRTIMITGDTALTGVFIARQCGMTISPKTRVLLGDYDKTLNGDRVVWTDVDEPETFSDVNVDDALHNMGHTPMELAVTGKAFQWLVDHDLIRKYLLDIRVFARMTPIGKVQCIQLHMERGITAMTGDGGNDCGALRAAHVGIAMSDAEASIVSPFSTSVRSVSSCVELLKQGRGALATSLTCYKYLILYGQVMMMLKIFSFYFSIAMSQYIWIGIDVFITVLLTWAVSQSKAADQLAPTRPTARLLGPQTMASCIGLVALNWIFMSCGMHMLFQQEWFRCNEFDSNAVDLSKWWLLADSYESEVVAIIVLFMVINNAAVFSFGHKFRQNILRNYPLLFFWALYMAIVSYWVLADPNRFGCLFRVNCGTAEVLEQLGYSPLSVSIEQYNTPLGHNVLPVDFRWKLWGLCVGNVVASLSYERLIVLGPIRKYLAAGFPRANGRVMTR